MQNSKLNVKVLKSNGDTSLVNFLILIFLLNRSNYIESTTPTIPYQCIFHLALPYYLPPFFTIEHGCNRNRNLARNLASSFAPICQNQLHRFPFGWRDLHARSLAFPFDFHLARRISSVGRI